jgi:hypothetical protein
MTSGPGARENPHRDADPGDCQRPCTAGELNRPSTFPPGRPDSAASSHWPARLHQEQFDDRYEHVGPGDRESQCQVPSGWGRGEVGVRLRRAVEDADPDFAAVAQQLGVFRPAGPGRCTCLYGQETRCRQRRSRGGCRRRRGPRCSCRPSSGGGLPRTPSRSSVLADRGRCGRSPPLGGGPGAGHHSVWVILPPGIAVSFRAPWCRPHSVHPQFIATNRRLSLHYLRSCCNVFTSFTCKNED